MLHESGVVDLDQPVVNYLPEDVSVSTTPEVGAKITLRQLASHTSGLPRGVPGRVQSVEGWYELEPQRLCDHLANVSLGSDPGSEELYSNLGFGLLGHALERAADKPFDQLIQELICDPLRLEGTAIPTEGKLHTATGYDGSSWRVERTHSLRARLAGSGGLVTTAEDLAKFLAAQMEPGVFSSQILEQLHTRTTRSEAGNKGDGGLFRKRPPSPLLCRANLCPAAVSRFRLDGFYLSGRTVSCNYFNSIFGQANLRFVWDVCSQEKGISFLCRSLRMNRGSLTAAVRFPRADPRTQLTCHISWQLSQVSSLMVRKQPLSRRMRESLLTHCDQIGADDCVDPSQYFQPNRTQSKQNKKSLQLCRQVACCLNLVLGDCDDPIVQHMSVLSVAPAPDCSRLLVTLAVDRPMADGPLDHDHLLTRVTLQLPRLRHEIARAIHRKRVPNLALQLVPAFSKTEDSDE